MITFVINPPAELILDHRLLYRKSYYSILEGNDCYKVIYIHRPPEFIWLITYPCQDVHPMAPFTNTD